MPLPAPVPSAASISLADTTTELVYRISPSVRVDKFDEITTLIEVPGLPRQEQIEKSGSTTNVISKAKLKGAVGKTVQISYRVGSESGTAESEKAAVNVTL